MYILTDGKEWVVIFMHDNSLFSIITFRYYKEAHMLIIKTCENISKIKGLGRAAIIKGIKEVVKVLKYPNIYLYSRAKPFFYLISAAEPIHPEKLCAFWVSIMKEISYKIEIVGYKEIRAEKEKTLTLFKEHIKKIKQVGILEDDPISRVLQHNPLLKPKEVAAILSNSKDLTNGHLMFGVYDSEKDTFTDSEENGKAENVYHLDPEHFDKTTYDIITAPSQLLLNENYLYTKINIDKKELQRPAVPPVKIIRLKKRHSIA